MIPQKGTSDMMRFSKINEEMQAAMVQFCIEQEIMSPYDEDDEIEKLVESAFSVMNRVPNSVLHETPIYRYHFFGDKAEKEIFPDTVKENGLLISAAIHLATIHTEEYISDGGIQKLVTSSCDVVFDMETEEIRLLYRIVNSDEAVTSVYRTEIETLDIFDAREFIIEVTAQLLNKLYHNKTIIA